MAMRTAMGASRAGSPQVRYPYARCAFSMNWLRVYRSGVAREWQNMPTLFFTGYPGFLCSELLPRILARREGATAVCIVQPKFAALARERAGPLGDRVRIVEGDIGAPLSL